MLELMSAEGCSALIGPELHAHPRVWGGVKPTGNHIASEQNRGLLTAQEKWVRGRQSSRCAPQGQESQGSPTVFHCHLALAREGKSDLTEAIRGVKNIFWMEIKGKRALFCISVDGRKPLADDTSYL